MEPAETVQAFRPVPAGGRAWWAAILMLAAVVSTPILVGVLAVEIQADLGIGDGALGLCVTAFWACTGLTALAGGRLIDRAGWRRAALAGLAVSLVSQLGVATSGSVAALLAWLVVAGAGYGVVAPASNLVVVREIPARLRGTALGAKQSATPVVALLAGLAVPLVALTIGWQWAFVLATLLTVAAAATSLPRTRPSPRATGPEHTPAPTTQPARKDQDSAGSAEETRPTPAGPGLTASSGSAGAAGEVRSASASPGPVASAGPAAAAGDVRSAPASPGFAAVAGEVRVGSTGPRAVTSLVRVSVVAGLGTLSIGSLTTFAVSTLTRAGLDVSTAGLVISVTSLVSLVVRLGAGRLADRRGSDGFRPAAVMIAACALGMLAMASGGTALTVAGTVVAFCGAWGWPALLLMGVLAQHPDRPGVAGARFQLGTALGAATGPLLFAAVSEAAGLPAAWLTVTACTAVSAALVLLSSRTRVAGRG
ncbi:MFS transporter [Nonomuraea sp. C10]|uniref:MFS transporter n=1 Tax=Nonomuraea sp. C10 TaxID=2600577 RepID=UPI0011CE5801|nr:MFS transporter [Nonomuraea sp. C10]TXK40269.1 MFS transporter [Nonomuraea sp. C10]